MNHDVDQTVKNFRNAVVAYSGDDGDQNDDRLYEVMRESFHRLEDSGDSGHNALIQLLDDESGHVRCWVAAALLVKGHSDARRILEEVARASDGMLGFSAEITLEEFEKGRLRTPFPRSR